MHGPACTFVLQIVLAASVFSVSLFRPLEPATSLPKLPSPGAHSQQTKYSAAHREGRGGGDAQPKRLKTMPVRGRLWPISTPHKVAAVDLKGESGLRGVCAADGKSKSGSPANAAAKEDQAPVR
ncbi:hypothetical protein C8R47DRAFT_1074437 [Mycena vitilis]|nr:hypothetical protein C8R47DRAFT_1074437 [Mycena vitilis]